MAFSLEELDIPVVGAPMAGGPSTPELAAAVSEAGGLGFLAGGYLSAERFAETIEAARALTSGPLAVNVFVPQQDRSDADEVQRYCDELTVWAEHYGAQVGTPRPGDDDGWAAKLDVIADLAPEAASFTFGCPPAAVLDRLRQRGVLTLVTVTSAPEAAQAVRAGADGLVVQGPGAGGHRGTFRTGDEPGAAPLATLLGRVRAVTDLPLIAAGGLGSAADVAAVRAGGAVAAQVGTVLLLTEEAGTNPVHRAALQNPAFSATVVTRAFSGRYARSLVNDFTRRFDPIAPPAYPELQHLTAPIRKAAVAEGDPQGASLWAGTAHAAARAGSAGEIVAGLAG
ncbi:nitronate monooxygenase [Mycolicibacillus trivialis]